MKSSLLQLTASGALVLLLATQLARGQGTFPPTTPPATPIMKTLQQVEPRTDVLKLPGDSDSQYVISAPGSYYLTANLVGVAAKNGIKITVSDVTLDLNGFALSGVLNSQSAIMVAASSGSVSNVAIYNGAIDGWGADGVNADDGENSRIERLRLTHNSLGVEAGGHCVVQGCQAMANGWDGFRVGPQSTVADCTAIRNGKYGFYVEEQTTVADCVAEGNGGLRGGDGFYGESNITFDRCKSSNNADQGFNVLRACILLRSTATGNGSIGLYLFHECTTQGCVAIDNTSWGFAAGYDNCVVKDCLAKGNGGGGIKLGSRCVAQDNSCCENGGQGIFASGNENRIDSNHVMAPNSTLAAIEVADGAVGNVIVRNYASSKQEPSAYTVPALNAVGPRIGSMGPISSVTGWENFDKHGVD